MLAVFLIMLLIAVFPIPIAHLYLHALLSHWRKRPRIFYLFCTALWCGSAIFILHAQNLFPNPLFLFDKIHLIAGIAPIMIGLCLIASSIFSLGIRNFFLWSVLNPKKFPPLKKPKLFKIFPHPAYLGYFLIIIGDFIAMRTPIALISLISFLILIPIVIFMEEGELRNRDEL